MGLTNTPTDLLPGTLELLILKALRPAPEARLRHRRSTCESCRKTCSRSARAALYPALQRLLLNGWVKAEWGDVGEQPPRALLHADRRRPQATGGRTR